MNFDNVMSLLEKHNSHLFSDDVFTNEYYHARFRQIRSKSSVVYSLTKNKENVIFDDTFLLNVGLSLSGIDHPNKEKRIEVAKFHDLGEFVAKQWKEDKAVFYSHENISAMYHFAYIDEVTQANLEITEAIAQHMRAHNTITQKTIKKYQLTYVELDLIERFRVIDNQCKIV